jgi:hypothetical protein
VEHDLRLRGEPVGATEEHVHRALFLERLLRQGLADRHVVVAVAVHVAGAREQEPERRIATAPV